jgi:hypothetical protein
MIFRQKHRHFIVKNVGCRPALTLYCGFKTVNSKEDERGKYLLTKLGEGVLKMAMSKKRARQAIFNKIHTFSSVKPRQNRHLLTKLGRGV